MMKIAQSSAGIRGIGAQADYFQLSGVSSPGLATLKSVNAAQSWDVRKAYGTSWATAVPSGEELSKIVFEVRIWVASDSQAWDTFANTYLARPVQSAAGTNPAQVKSLSFAHDVASAPPYNVNAVVVSDVRYLGQVEPGVIAHEVELLEWKQPLPAPPAPNQATPASPQGPPAATDALGAEQNQITSQGDALENQLALLRDR
jgi:hypothetical protein